jgi:hypothetical protein
MSCLRTVTADMPGLVEIFDSFNSSVIVAGHYSVAAHMSDFSDTGPAELMSFALGAELVQRSMAHGRISRVVLWINDIGIDQVERAKLRQQYAIPDNYATVIKNANLNEDNIKVMYESSTRNKASTTLRKLYTRKPHLFTRIDASEKELVRCVNNNTCAFEERTGEIAYVIRGPNNEQLVIKEGPNPKCNLILATLFHDLTELFAPSIIVNIFNDIYEYRITLGEHVARTIFGLSTPIMNVFCDGANLNFEYHEAEKQSNF